MNAAVPFSTVRASALNPVAAVLHWAEKFPYVQLFFIPSAEPGDAWVAGGSVSGFSTDRREAVNDWLHSTKGEWRHIALAYPFRDSLHGLNSRHRDHFGWPEFAGFVPDWQLRWENAELQISAASAELLEELSKLDLRDPRDHQHSAVTLQPLQTREEYLQSLEQIRYHLQRGDIYEVNYCTAWEGRAPGLLPHAVFLRLAEITRAPHCAYWKWEDKHLMCGSPERFLRKSGEVLQSEPIKGTAPRSADPERDLELKQGLVNSTKERAENVMIVDLVRHDLSHTALPGSVLVDRLFEPRTFATVHQLVSTVSSRVRPETEIMDILATCFPMGSMTGAPKRRAMEIIDRLEVCSRGLYSGSVGYLTPDDDFDLNVVIRSIQYREDSGLLSANVGSAITVWADPEQEYAECLLKVEALLKTLQP